MTPGGPPPGPPSSAPTFGRVLRTREFRFLWIADAQSLLGDQLARVALAILVYDRTRSGLATAAVYALTFLPALAGNLALGPLADRLPRRQTLVLGDVARAGLLALMALPSVPIGVLMGLLTLAVFLGAPWKAAETALVAEVLAEQDYPVGVGVRTATLQAAQLVGFAIGGVAVSVLGARTALAIDAATFLASATLIRVGVRARPAVPGIDAEGSRRWFAGVGAILADPPLRRLLNFSWLLGLLVIPEGLAAPYAHVLGEGPAAVGLLLASLPTGVLLGSLVFSRWVPDPARARMLGPLAILSGLPLVACALTPALAVTMLLWALSGTATAYQVQVMTEYVPAVVAARRAQALGLASAGLLAAQGIGLLLGGGIAQWLGPAAAIAIAGGSASALAALLAVGRMRARERAAH